MEQTRRSAYYELERRGYKTYTTLGAIHRYSICHAVSSRSIWRHCARKQEVSTLHPTTAVTLSMHTTSEYSLLVLDAGTETASNARWEPA